MAFFTQLDIPEPHINLGVSSVTQATQTANIMIRYEEAIKTWKPELCMVVGDITSTMACATVAKKEWVKIAHIEGGIRSGDEKMPEEINRMVTDSITDYFFTTSEVTNKNLASKGHKKEKIFYVGNTMIDSLLGNLNRLIQPSLCKKENLSPKSFIVITLHRPSNVGAMESLRLLLEIVNAHVGDKKVVFPMHIPA